VTARAGRIGVALICVLALLAVAASVAAASTRSAGLDTSYGKRGVADMTGPFASPGEREESDLVPFIDARAFAAADDGSAYVVVRRSYCRKQCADGTFLERLDPRGQRDADFGGPGGAVLPKSANAFGVVTDPGGRPVVGTLEEGDVVLRRFTRAGRPDRTFGEGGTVRLNCDCFGYTQLRLLRSPDRRLLVDVNVYLSPGHEPTHAFRANLYRLLPDGRPDRTLGGSGSVVVRFRAPELPSSVVVDPRGAILLGGFGRHQIYLERVGATGRPDRGFARTASASARRLNRLGEFPSLAAALPGPGGGVDVVGSSQERRGYYLRLSRDGRLERGFGGRGLIRLPFAVNTAVGGTGGAIFVAGEERRYGGYRAFRVLSSGRLDPAFHGASGLPIPLGGVKVHVAAAGPGRVLVFDNGNYFCRSGCSSEPAVARFLE
jgi:hypothetical protein